MASMDKLFVEIDGQELAVFSGRLAALENDNRQIQAEIGELGHKLDLVLVRMDAMGTRIEDMKFYMSLTFGAIAVFVAAVTLSPIVSRIIQAWKNPNDDERMSRIFREEYAKLNADGKPI